MGGTYTPLALIEQTIVIPFSALTTFPTCFNPRFAIICPGFCTLVMPDSSKLNIWCALNLLSQIPYLVTHKICLLAHD